VKGEYESAGRRPAGKNFARILPRPIYTANGTAKINVDEGEWITLEEMQAA
jgi:hypothetical protein